MFDRMTIKSILHPDSVPRIIEAWHLVECTRGGDVFWQSSAYGNFDAMFITVRGCRIILSFSLHKRYYKDAEGVLDNSREFRMSWALDALGRLAEEFGLDPAASRVTYFELGLNLPVSCDPLRFIASAERSVGREMFVDANYEKDRQRTTEKSRTHRKILKMYDKTFEAAQKRRRCDPDILRLETIYRHQSLSLAEFMDAHHTDTVTRIFWDDWSSLAFARELEADKGMKASQTEKARDIMLLGVDEYLRRGLEAYRERRLTKKTWETMRVFAKNWQTMSHHFRWKMGKIETEYQRKLYDYYSLALK